MTDYIRLARASVTKHSRHVSFLLYRNRIASIGINNPFKTHPRNRKYNFRGRNDEDISHFVGIHSELSAVIKLGEEDLSKYDLVNVRINKNGNVSLSKPCNGCTDMINQLGIRKVLYTNDAGEFVEF